jgi:hypothetical protein
MSLGKLSTNEPTIEIGLETAKEVATAEHLAATTSLFMWSAANLSVGSNNGNDFANPSPLLCLCSS